MAHASIPASALTSAHVVSFRASSELACSNVGGRVLSCSDDFFASKDNLIQPSTPIFIPGKFTEQGKWMDGWESRRKRVAGYDWAVLALGTPGHIQGFTVDTSYFVGNYPESMSLEGAISDKHVLTESEIGALKWTELVPKSGLAGGTANYFPLASPDPKAASTRYTHIRFNIFPDGGVARLRVHGVVQPDWKSLVAASKHGSSSSSSAPAGLIDVASVINGAKVITSNDAFFGAHSNLILPGRAETMGDGWETRRKRVLPGHDWIIVELGTTARIKKIEVDTNHFKGNFPDSCLIEGLFLDPTKKECQAISSMDFHRPNELFQFVPILPQVKLQASHQHYYEAAQLENKDTPITHIRMKIFPDGGISRLRMWGEVQL